MRFEIDPFPCNLDPATCPGYVIKHDDHKVRRAGQVYPVIIVKGDVVSIVREYAKDCLIIGTEWSCNLWLVENLKATRKIVGDDPNDLRTCAVRPLKDFDPIAFPFMVCNGTHGIDLLCLNTGVRQALVKFSAYPNYGTPVAIFPDEPDESNKHLYKEGHPIHMIFESAETKPDGKREYRIHRLALHGDFFDILRQIGRLPAMTIHEVTQLENDLQKSRLNILEKDEKISDL